MALLSLLNDTEDIWILSTQEKLLHDNLIQTSVELLSAPITLGDKKGEKEFFKRKNNSYYFEDPFWFML